MKPRKKAEKSTWLMVCEIGFRITDRAAVKGEQVDAKARGLGAIEAANIFLKHHSVYLTSNELQTLEKIAKGEKVEFS